MHGLKLNTQNNCAIFPGCMHICKILAAGCHAHYELCIQNSDFEYACRLDVMRGAMRIIHSKAFDPGILYRDTAGIREF